MSASGGCFREGGFYFFSNFDSGNLGSVQSVGAGRTRGDECVDASSAASQTQVGERGADAGEEGAAAVVNPEEAPPAAKPAATTPARPKKRSRRQRRSATVPCLAPPPPPPEATPTPSTPSDAEFDLWTRKDCQGTEFENGNRTWFFFGIRRDWLGSFAAAGLPMRASHLLKLNVRNLNKQSKLFSQGMVPIVMTLPLPSSSSSSSASSSSPLQPPLSCVQRWERLRERPTFGSSDSGGGFDVSFRVRVEARSVTYVAFTYPYAYRELQNYLARLERKHAGPKSASAADFEDLKERDPNSIYFTRELVCRSLQGRRLDLLTISSVSDALPEREDRLPGLFPVNDDKGKEQASPECPRPFKFRGKKVVFLSSRVHPGETQSSFVFNGFLKFLLREEDPRAVALRKRYVFKLIPMLNPDGVVNGHYRTDTRGVNLNRVYQRPSASLHPTIFAARALLLYAHHGRYVPEAVGTDSADVSTSEDNAGKDTGASEEHDEAGSIIRVEVSGKPETSAQQTDQESLKSGADAAHWLRSSLMQASSSAGSSKVGLELPVEGDPAASAGPSSSAAAPTWYEMTETSRFSEGDESIADFSAAANPSMPHAGRRVCRTESGSSAGGGGFGGARADDVRTSFRGVFPTAAPPSKKAPQEERKDLLLLAPPPPLEVDSLEGENSSYDFEQRLNSTLKGEKDLEGERVHQSTSAEKMTTGSQSGCKSHIFIYVDVHGHASKRGIFMYGNHFANADTKVDAMLMPKLMSINCANFDFPACNFTERNMYLKDRHTGAGREGSGRVSAFKATGLVYSYTMECNFNTGRIVNSIPMASRDAGRATPPPIHDHPPKYDPTVYEDSGKALAISILDLTESNPWTRLTCSACKNLKGVRDAIKRDIKQNEEAAVAKQQKGNNSSVVGGGSASPTRRGRRHRTTSATLATGGKKVTRAKGNRAGNANAPAGSRVAGAVGDKASALKAPVSPDSYRPVSKIPRKNSQAKKQSSSVDKGHQRRLSSASKQGRTSWQRLQRSRSIPGLPSAEEIDALTPLVHTDKPAGKLTRSKSNPASRPQSPRRMKADATKAKGKKTKKQGRSASKEPSATAALLPSAAPPPLPASVESRKNSDASLSVSSSTVSAGCAPSESSACSSVASASRKKKLSAAGGSGIGKKKKKRKNLPKYT